MKILTQDTVRQTSYTYVNKTTTSQNNNNYPSFGYYQLKHPNVTSNRLKTAAIAILMFLSVATGAKADNTKQTVQADTSKPKTEVLQSKQEPSLAHKNEQPEVVTSTNNQTIREKTTYIPDDNKAKKEDISKTEDYSDVLAKIILFLGVIVAPPLFVLFHNKSAMSGNWNTEQKASKNVKVADNILQGTVLYKLQKEENNINNNNKKMYKSVPKADVTKQPAMVLYPKKFPRRIKAADGKVYKRVFAPCNGACNYLNMMYIPESEKEALSFESDYYYTDRSKCPYNVGKKEVVSSEKFNKMPRNIMIGQNLFEKEQKEISDNMIEVMYVGGVDLTLREGVIYKEDLDKFPPIICDADGKYYLRDSSGNYEGNTFIRFTYTKIARS